MLGCAVLSAGCGAGSLGGRFVNAVRPSTNVVSDQHPDFDRYKVQRIVVLPFEDRTGDPFIPPDTGMKLASFFYDRLKSHEIYSLEGPGAQEAAMVQMELVKPAPAPHVGEEEAGGRAEADGQCVRADPSAETRRDSTKRAVRVCERRHDLSCPRRGIVQAVEIGR